MKLFQQLHKELKSLDGGLMHHAYYRYLGLRQDYAAEPAMLRANAVHALFSETKPYILHGELIAGNKKCLYCDADAITLAHAEKIVHYYGDRRFSTNKDHFAPYYTDILELGVPGLIAKVDSSIKAHEAEPEKVTMLKAMRHTLRGFLQMIANHIPAAEACKEDPTYETANLDFIIGNCRALLEGKPQTFAQALQLIWFCHHAFQLEERGAMALGRLDQYLYPFYQKDIDAGIITDAEVVELLENIFIRLIGDVVNICIGGQDIHGNCQVNGLSYCILWAVNNCHVPGPNLSLRYTKNIPDDFFDECLKVIGTGLGYPAIMNDDINIAALKRYGYAKEEDIYNYSMVGCIENFITGMQPPWTDGRFDTPTVFDFVFNHGISKCHQRVGLDTGDVDQISSMEEFLKAIEAQVSFSVAEYYYGFRVDNEKINQNLFPDPFLSCFCVDCIGRGLDINNGGAIYPSVHGTGLLGTATMADSLAAIEKVIFCDKEATLSELGAALNANFEGYEALQEKLLAAPKYGNNDDFVDKYAVWFVDFLMSQFDLYRTRTGGYLYGSCGTNVSNVFAGRHTNATPDGRKRGEPLSDAASPFYGRDTRGVTAAFNSLCKPDHTKLATGNVVNQKIAPSMFTDEKRGKLAALLRAYMAKGGQEIQINATSRETLIDAMDHPENYQDLVVRVSGFSAFYVTLDRDVQLDILNRTERK